MPCPYQLLRSIRHVQRKTDPPRHTEARAAQTQFDIRGTQVIDAFEIRLSVYTQVLNGSLGLSMVERYVYACSARMEVTSTSERRGATFLFTWQKAPEPEERHHPA